MFTHINFQTIGVIDQDRAIAFYRDKLDMNVQTDMPYGENSRWIFMQIGEARTFVHLSKVEEVQKSEMPVLALVTEDVDAACETLTSRGVTIHKGPDDAPWNPGTRWAMIYDTEDNLILLQTV